MYMKVLSLEFRKKEKIVIEWQIILLTDSVTHCVSLEGTYYTFIFC